MLNHKKLAKKPKLFLSMTGVTPGQFYDLCPEIESQYKITEERRLSRNNRIRDIGAGRRFKHCRRDRILMALIHYRTYVTQGLLSLLFDLSQSNVSTGIRYMEPAIKSALSLPDKKLAETRQISDIRELACAFPGLHAIIDASEQQIQRPKNKSMRKTHYSGKKKMHTVKTQYVVNADGMIMHRTPHSPGSRHDYSVFKSKCPKLSRDLKILVDLGYQGIRKDYPELDVLIPYKKPRGGKLDDAQKEFNRELSRARVLVEHVISRIKKFGIMRDKFRNRLCRYDCINAIICGLINYKLKTRDFVVIP